MPPDLAATRLRPEKIGTEASRATLTNLNEAEEDAAELRDFGLQPLAEQRARS